MLRNLRLRLTLLYLLASVILIVVMGAGIYRALRSYFQTITDLALQQQLQYEFLRLGAPMPPTLQMSSLAGRLRQHGKPHPPDTPEQPVSPSSNERLSAVFVMLLSADGRLLFNPGMFAAPIEPDTEAVAIAQQQGSDWRTITTSDGTQVRLLTYRLTRDDGPSVIQLGRTLDEQNQVLQQVLRDMLILGGVSAVAMGFGSWWLAGRSIVPAQQAWERQQTFIANASHELRAPLTLLRASAEVAQRGLASNAFDIEDTRELLGDVLHECDHMNRMVEDLLLLSRLDAGKLTVQRVEIALPALLSDIQRQVGRLADDQQIELVVEPCQGRVWGDPAHLRQVLLILLDNALGHTPAGGTMQIATTELEQFIEICVSDTGSGIAPEHLPHIFERFYRPDSTRTVERSGAGLGLSIAKALTEAQHGHISVASEPGKGTEVRIILDAVV